MCPSLASAALAQGEGYPFSLIPSPGRSTGFLNCQKGVVHASRGSIYHREPKQTKNNPKKQTTNQPKFLLAHILGAKTKNDTCSEKIKHMEMAGALFDILGQLVREAFSEAGYFIQFLRNGRKGTKPIFRGRDF